MAIRHSIQIVLLAAGLGSAAGVWADDDTAAPIVATRQFPAPVEAWRSLIDQAAAGSGVPTDFLLKWVQVESFGNPCSLGIPGIEAGIAQTYHPDDDLYGATFDQLRAACVPDTQKQARPLRRRRSGCRSGRWSTWSGNSRVVSFHLLAAGVNWPETSADFWSLVSLRHALPAWVTSYLGPCGEDLGHAPATWAEFRGWIEGAVGQPRRRHQPRRVRPWASLAERRKALRQRGEDGQRGGARGDSLTADR